MTEIISRRSFLRKADNYARLFPGAGPLYGLARDAGDSLRSGKVEISPWTLAGIVGTDILLLSACEPATEEVVRLEKLITDPSQYENKVIETSGYSIFAREKRYSSVCQKGSIPVGKIQVPVMSHRDNATQVYEVRSSTQDETPHILMTVNVHGNCGKWNTIFGKLPNSLVRIKAKVLPYDSSTGPSHYLNYYSHKKPE